MFLHIAVAALTYLASLLGHPLPPLVTPIATHPPHAHTTIPQTMRGLTIFSIPSPTPPAVESHEVVIPILQASISASVTPTVAPTDTPLPSPTFAPTATPKPTTTPFPTPSPALVASVQSPADLDTLFSKYADQYHADKNLLEKIAKCESSFNTNADYMGYAGMFQFAASSWTSVRGQMGADPNPDLRKNTEEAIKTAAYMIGGGHSSAWPSCEK